MKDALFCVLVQLRYIARAYFHENILSATQSIECEFYPWLFSEKTKRKNVFIGKKGEQNYSQNNDISAPSNAQPPSMREFHLNSILIHTTRRCSTQYDSDFFPWKCRRETPIRTKTCLGMPEMKNKKEKKTRERMDDEVKCGEEAEGRARRGKKTAKQRQEVIGRHPTTQRTKSVAHIWIKMNIYEASSVIFLYFQTIIDVVALSGF